MESIVESLARVAEREPNKIAIVAEEEQISYKDLWKEVRGFASYLHSLGLEDGARIVVKAQHSIWFAVACFGIHLAGCVHVPVERTIGVDAISDIADQLSASMIISDIIPNTVSRLLLPSNSVRAYARQFFDQNSSFSFPESEALCDILFTTGTTGKPKGVMLSHRAVFAVAQNVQMGTEIRDDNIYLIPAPMNHASGIRNLYVCILTGTTAVLLNGYTNIKLFFDYIRKYHVTSLYMPPSAVRMILLLASKELIKYKDQIRFVYTSSAPFPEADKELLKKVLPNSHLYFAYGCSEAGRSCIIDYSKAESKVNCAGKPNVNSRIIIVDANRAEIHSSPENQGLIAISGPTVMNGYYNDPELTKQTLENGIVYTNDIGYVDENGDLYVLGRIGDVINLGGLKIAPTEVENVVLRFPGIADCACFAAQDRLGGPVLKLNIVENGSPIDITSLRAYLQRNLEAYKVPKIITTVKSIPKTANGKTKRSELK